MQFWRIWSGKAENKAKYRVVVSSMSHNSPYFLISKGYSPIFPSFLRNIYRDCTIYKDKIWLLYAKISRIL